jgi:hypothetical protein
MSVCVGSIYCSGINTTLFAQYFKIGVITYVGNALKTWSLRTITKYLILITLAISSLKIFQFSVNANGSDYDYPMLRQFSGDQKNFHNSEISGQSILVQVFTMLVIINDILNYVLLTVLNTEGERN